MNNTMNGETQNSTRDSLVKILITLHILAAVKL